MKQFVRLFLLILVSVFGIFSLALAQEEYPYVLAQDDSLPILGSKMIDISNHPVTFSNGSFFDVFAEISLDFAGSVRNRPILHSSVALALPGLCTMRGLIAGTTAIYSSPCEAVIQFTPSSEGDGYSFDTEMLSLMISGGTLPSGVMIRESPTLASTGKSKSIPVSPGVLKVCYTVNNLELSTDGGGTWTPGDVPVTLQMIKKPIITSFTPVAGSVPAGTATGDIDRDGYPDIVLASRTALPSPPVGSPVTAGMDCDVRYMYDGVDRLITNAPCNVKVTQTFDDGSTHFFDTEMLSMDLSGGTLPGGVMVRESPSKASLGRTSVRPIGSGQTEISSFFDVFIEVSTDGGSTWGQALKDVFLLQFTDTLPAPSSGPTVCAPGPVYPDDHHPFHGMLEAKSPGPPQVFLNGMSARNYLIKSTAGPSPLPPLGGSQLYTEPVEVHIVLAPDAISPPVDVQMFGNMIDSYIHQTDDGLTRRFDTEMLALNLTGSGGGLSVMLRESPTRASTGKTAIEPNAGGWRIGSFFDVFTEISTDGGATWSPSAESTRVVQELRPPDLEFGTTSFPPPGIYTWRPGCNDVGFTNGAVWRLGSFFDIFTEITLPPPGGSSSGTVTARGPRQSVSLDGSFSFFDVFVDISMTMDVTSTNTTATDRFFDTEMLSMSLTGHGGGGAGGALLIRESPTLPSKGKTYIRESPTLPSRTSSFFDVFTEMSLDGGATWSPALHPIRFELDTLSPGSIAGTKWHDNDGDGVRDGGDDGLAGWKIVLADTLGNPVDSTLTDVSGNYSFPGVPNGSYTVFEELQPGWIQTGGSPAYGFWLLPGDSLYGLDFANFRTSGLSGVKFNDHNGDGVRDPGDEGLQDWEICLKPKTPPPVGTEMSTATGGFSMTLNDMPAGTSAIGTLTGSFISRRGYNYYQAQSALQSTRGGPGGFHNGDIPLEMLAMELHSAEPVQIGGSFFDITYVLGKNDNWIFEGGGTLMQKGWDGTIKGRPPGSSTRSSFFDVFIECIVSPRDHASGLPTGKRMHLPIRIKSEVSDSPDPQALEEGVLYTADPTEIFDEDGVSVGSLDAMSFTIGAPVSPINPICVKTDSNGVYTFLPVPPGTWTVVEHGQPCWDPTTPAPPPITVMSNTAGSCESPDNGAGTADLPAACDYTGGKMMIIDGLAAASTTESDARFHTFTSITRTPGGTLGGESDQFAATLTLDMQGTGDYSGFYRVFAVPVSLATFDHAPRTPSAPVQSFASELMGVQGQITGDPDFDLLRITGGTSFGLPSPGHTTLTKSGPKWKVDSFFDITYRIDFVGHPGGAFSGRSGSTTGTIRWSQGGSTNLPDIDFGNHERGGTICIAKYHDINHNQLRDPGEPSMSGVSFVLTNMGTAGETTEQTDGTGMAYFGNLPDGDYRLTEIVPAGYTISLPKAGEQFFSVANCDTQRVTWLNAGALTDTMFRTATYEEWATAVDAKNGRKPIKCKPDKVDFKLNLVVPTLATPVSILELKFSMPTDINGVWADGKNKSVPYCYDTTKTTVDLKHQLYRFDLTEICGGSSIPPTPGQMIQFDGLGHKGALIKVTYKWFTAVPGTSVVVKGSLPGKPFVIPGDEIKPVLRLPMPNLVNVLQELQTQLVFPIVVGGVVGDTHSVYIKSYSDLLKSLAKAQRGGPYILHDSTHLGDCLDSLNGKRIKKQLKGLPPEKYQHRLFAEALTLKLNILASRYRKFPAGFDTLIYDYHKIQPGPFDGKTVAEILRQVEAFISCKDNPKPGANAQDYFFVLRRINEAFSGPIDTVRWSCLKLEMTGVRKLKDVIYMRADPGAFADYIEPPKEATGMNAVPSEFALMQNYPNPFNPTTNIEFELAEPSLVTLKIYNTLGQEVATLLNGVWLEDGSQAIEFDAGNLPSGVYFYRIMAQGVGDEEEGLLGQQFVSVKKMILVK